MQTLDAFCGDEITSTIAMAIEKAKVHGDQCRFEFNGVHVIVAEDSDAGLIYRDWSRGLSGYLGKNTTIGPYPKLDLDDDEIASDAAIKAENERRQRQRAEEWRLEQAAAQAHLASLLGDAPLMEFSNRDKWLEACKKNSDPYGSAVYRYAEKWARLMQARISKGGTVASCAKETSRIADDEGITGFMYGCAVGALAACWIHGEELRIWHNNDTQIGNGGDRANEEGGVLNPAILNIGAQPQPERRGP